MTLKRILHKPVLLGAIGLAVALAAGLSRGQGNPAPAPAKAGKDLVAVLDFDAVGATKPQASAITDRLQDALLKQRRFTLVDRGQIQKILNEQAFQQTGCSSQECAVQAGKVLGVKHIVTGRVTKIDDGTWQLAGSLIDVESAETLRAESIPHRGDYFSLLNETAVQLAEKLSSPVVSPAQAADDRAGVDCSPDVRAFCAKVEPGGGRIAACLAQNESKLNRACQDARQAQRTIWQRRGRACQPDTQRLCQAVIAAKGNTFECLRQHISDLSAECRSLMP